MYFADKCYPIHLSLKRPRVVLAIFPVYSHFLYLFSDEQAQPEQHNLTWMTSTPSRFSLVETNWELKNSVTI